MSATHIFIARRELRPDIMQPGCKCFFCQLARQTPALRIDDLLQLRSTRPIDGKPLSWNVLCYTRMMPRKLQNSEGLSQQPWPFDIFWWGMCLWRRRICRPLWPRPDWTQKSQREFLVLVILFFWWPTCSSSEFQSISEWTSMKISSTRWLESLY